MNKKNSAPVRPLCILGWLSPEPLAWCRVLLAKAGMRQLVKLWKLESHLSMEGIIRCVCVGTFIILEAVLQVVQTGLELSLLVAEVDLELLSLLPLLPSPRVGYRLVPPNPTVSFVFTLKLDNVNCIIFPSWNLRCDWLLKFSLFIVFFKASFVSSLMWFSFFFFGHGFASTLTEITCLK